jgi:hypothetical protein
LDCGAIRAYRYEQYVKHSSLLDPGHHSIHNHRLYTRRYYFLSLCTCTRTSVPSASPPQHPPACRPATRHFQLSKFNGCRQAVPSVQISTPCLCWRKVLEQRSRDPGPADLRRAQMTPRCSSEMQTQTSIRKLNMTYRHSYHTQ